MPDENSAVVYVETNWLLALAMPHDARCGTARMLQRAAAHGACEIRVPRLALLEAKLALPKRLQELSSLVAELKRRLALAVANNVPLEAVRSALAAEPLDVYLRRNALVYIDAAIAAPNVTSIDLDRASWEIAEELRPKVKHGANDVADLTILAAIIQDRCSLAEERPAILVSSNPREFDPRSKKAKLPAGLFEEERIWFEALQEGPFDLETTVSRWRNKVWRA